jgi:hypothetical protein
MINAQIAPNSAPKSIHWANPQLLLTAFLWTQAMNLALSNPPFASRLHLTRETIGQDTAPLYYLPAL